MKKKVLSALLVLVVAAYIGLPGCSLTSHFQRSGIEPSIGEPIVVPGPAAVAPITASDLALSMADAPETLRPVDPVTGEPEATFGR